MSIQSRLIAPHACGNAGMQLLEHATLYHSAAWRQVLTSGFRLHTDFMISEADGELAAITPVFSKRFLGMTFMGSPLKGTFTEFMGPAYRPGLSEGLKSEIFDSQLQTLARQGGMHVEYSTEKDDGCAGQCQGKYGFVGSRKESLLLQLTDDLDQVWKGFETRARNMVRKAQKCQVEAGVEPFVGEVVGHYYAMIRDTFAHQGLTPPHPLSAYRALSEHLDSNRMLFVAARHEGQLVSGGVFLVDRQRMVFHSGASTPEGLTRAASSLVQWQAMNEAKARGIEQYDFGGIGIESIDKFKRSFGGVQIHHHRLVRTAPLLKKVEGVGTWLHKRGWLKIFR